MTVKRHLSGGTLRKVMAEEILRVLKATQGDSMALEKAALVLGVTPRTLRVWRGPVEKGGWEELQVKDAVEQFMGKL